MAMILAAVLGCSSDADPRADASTPLDAGLASEVAVLETYEVSQFNGDLVEGEPTADIAFYVTESGPLEWDELSTSIDRAKRIFSVVGVQLRVSSAILVSVPPEWQRLDPDDSDVPVTPDFLDSDLYAHLNEMRMRPTARNRAILEAIISYHPDQPNGVPKANTIHVLTLDEVPLAYYEWTGTAWTRSVTPTGGLSFPPYAYADRIPIDIRGVITLSTPFDPIFPQNRALSHEIGHKLINVSHEGVGVCPAFEADGTDLMLYGNGERIPEGAAGRWHRERLALSPFLYPLAEDVADFAATYRDGGIYRDDLYGSYVVDPPCP